MKTYYFSCKLTITAPCVP